MRYFIGTKFLNYSKKTLFNKPIPTIDLISIGIVSEGHTDCNYARPDGKGGCEYPIREYYAISKDFNLKEVWNKWQYNVNLVSGKNQQGKEYWLRDNVLKPIFDKLINMDIDYNAYIIHSINLDFTYLNFKRLINKYGKTNKQIAEEIKEFVYYKSDDHKTDCCLGFDNEIKPEFYGYYSAFDYVVFNQLFGDFSKYPKKFPMYFIDLKQELDRIQVNANKLKEAGINYKYNGNIEKHPNYPKQINEHNALQVAIWNKKLYEFLNKL